MPPGIEALGRLIAACPDTFGTAVFTTNFDPLVEVATRRAKGQSHTTFLAEDGRFSARHGDGCHVIHVHGLWSGEGFTAHTVAQLTRPRSQLRRDLERFLERSDLVVLGYGGWRDVFSEVITSIAETLSQARRKLAGEQLIQRGGAGEGWRVAVPLFARWIREIGAAG